MLHVCTTGYRLLAMAALIALGTSLPRDALTAQSAPPPRMDLAVSFDPDAALLRGSARLTLPPGAGLSLSLPDLTITAALLDYHGRENLPLQLEGDLITLPAADSPQSLLLSYEKVITPSPANHVGPEAIVLSADWHPVPDRPLLYSLEARVPRGFTAVSEADRFPAEERDGTVRFSFSQPLQTLTFAAAPYIRQQRQVREGLLVYTLFFPEDRHLAADYLDAAAAYLTRYEEEIGPYPYNHYVIAENPNPTGIALPTFTLLGRQVVRLPFIKETSLGHEILHSWFGNSVEIAAGSGNWCEGLTTYLADMAYREEAGEGAEARKETIQSYLSYVTAATPPLAEFVGAGHDRMTNRDVRSVGYGRSAFLFHELRRRLGPVAFRQAIRKLYREFAGSAASWKDVQATFQSLTDTDLDDFFNERLSRVLLPELEIAALRLSPKPDHYELSFTIRQLREPSYDLLVPVEVRTVGTTRTHEVRLTGSSVEVDLELDSVPLELAVDPGYDLMRTLSPEERSPIWSDLLGDRDTVVVLGDSAHRDAYAPILQVAERFSWQVMDDDAVETATGHNMVFLGLANPLSRGLFAQPGHPGSGFTLDVRINPLAPDKRIALISSSSAAETTAVAHRLSHYGRYSYLHFQNGALLEKRIRESAMGIRIELEQEPSGLALSALSDFERLADELAAYRVVYIGETHTSRADHLLQAMLIEALHQRNPNLAIGMEMFPVGSQAALDAYIGGADLSEAEFLKQSRYYDVWRYDYRLFRPIFAYARKHRIPVLGLNVERDIVSSVFKSGSFAELSGSQREAVPPDRDLDLPGYRERLERSFRGHGETAGGDGGLGGFLQAQSVWDESMAARIVDYLDRHPERSMVVLAGSQHTRKDSGIPPRVARRLPLSQAVVANMATSSADPVELRRANDFLFFLEAGDFPPSGKIGIVLEERQRGDTTEMVIESVNPEAPAAAAGLKENDVLVAIDGQPVATMQDVRLAMLGRSVGETVPLAIRRGDEAGAAGERRIDVELFNPAPARPHP